MTLENLKKIYDFSKEKRFNLLTVVFPFTFQFEDVEALSSPQEVVKQHALENQIPTLDLLEPLAERMRDEGSKPEDYFWDADHLSALGSEVVARLIVDHIVREELLSSPRTTPR